MMESRKLDESSKRAMLVRLAKAGSEVVTSESAVFGAKLERDREIKKASELGLSRREVAAAVGLTAAGIQQILARD